MSFTLLLTDVNSPLGKALEHELEREPFKLLAPSGSDLDWSSEAAVIGYFEREQPDLVINCRGWEEAYYPGGQWQLVSPGSKACYSYEPRTGKELWHVRHTAHTSVLRPLFSHDLAIFCTGLGGPQLWAVRPDGRGDVTATHVAWKATQGAPRTPSPIVVGDLLYMVEDSGLVTCLEVATGKEVWKERLGGNYAASPIYADGRLYLCSQQGKTTVLKPGRTFEALAANTLESGFMASPAVAGSALFLRTRTHLYRIDSRAPAVE